MKNKKIIKIFLLALTISLSFGIGGVIAITLKANDVIFNPSDSEFAVDNVEDALNKLYEVANSSDFKEEDLLSHFTTKSVSASSSDGSSRTATVTSSTNIDFTDISFLKINYTAKTQNRPTVWIEIGNTTKYLSARSEVLVIDTRDITGEQPVRLKLSDGYNAAFSITITLNSLIGIQS